MKSIDRPRRVADDHIAALLPRVSDLVEDVELNGVLEQVGTRSRVPKAFLLLTRMCKAHGGECGGKDVTFKDANHAMSISGVVHQPVANHRCEVDERIACVTFKPVLAFRADHPVFTAVARMHRTPTTVRLEG